MTAESMSLAAAPQRAPVDPIAGVAAGAAAGLVYLVAQALFAGTVHDADPWSPLQRISAMLLGADALPPSGDHDITVWGMALLIHLGVAVVLGRLVDIVVRDRHGMSALWRGAAVGLAVYAFDYWVVAPVAFPWFEDNRGVTTVLDHALFGAVAAWVYVQLRAWRSQRAALGA